jgi:hypothetical protein
MDSAYSLYADDGALDEYYAMRPELTSLQTQILQAFYRARREQSPDGFCTEKQIINHSKPVMLDSDLCVYIIKKLDDEWQKIRAEKIKKAAPK